MATQKMVTPKTTLLGTLFRDLRGNPFLWIFIGMVVTVGCGIILFRPQGAYPHDILYHITFALGTACTVAIVAAIIDRNYVTQEFGQIVRAQFVELDADHRSLVAQGFVRAHEPPFDFRKLFEMVRSGEEVWWLDTYCPRKDEFLKAITAALASGIRIRMLIIKQGCPNAAFRSEELSGTPDTGPAWNSGLADFHMRMRALAASSAGAFQVLEYDDLLAVPMYLIVGPAGARSGFFSFFLAVPSAHFVHYELQGGPLLVAMQNYFAAKWDRWSSRTGDT